MIGSYSFQNPRGFPMACATFENTAQKTLGTLACRDIWWSSFRWNASLKDRSHGGEPVPCQNATQESEEEWTVPDAHADEVGGMPPDLRMKFPAPEPPCCSLREGSGITPLSNLSTPLEHDPSNASYLPHRGIHSSGKIR